jgi:hypothetical protein
VTRRKEGQGCDPGAALRAQGAEGVFRAQPLLRAEHCHGQTGPIFHEQFIFYPYMK